MHEASIVKDLIKEIGAISRREGGPKITGVKVRVGALTGFSAAAFREHFQHAARGTVAERARLRIKVSEDPNDPLAQEVALESLEIEDILPRTVHRVHR